MIDDLPKPIVLYVAAENSGDTIKKWKAETKKKYQHTIEPLSSVQSDNKTIVTNRLTGNFPGSPIALEFVFTLSGDKIVALDIRS